MRGRWALLLQIVLVTTGCESSGLEPGEGFIDVNGGKAFYRVVGSADATPLLLVHGGPGFGSCSFASVAVLASERPVVMYDQLGSGRSDRPSDQTLWRIERFVDELETIRTALNLQRVHLLGQSWGAAIVVEYLITRKPQGVSSVTFSGPLLSTERWLADANMLLQQLPLSTQDTIKQHERAGTTNSPEYVAATEEFYRRFLLRRYPLPAFPDCPGNPDVYLQMWGPSEFYATGNLRQFDREAQLAEIKQPVLFLVGQYDETRLETIREFQLEIPGSQIEVLADAAHIAHLDQPETFNTAVRRFLAQVERR